MILILQVKNALHDTNDKKRVPRIHETNGTKVIAFILAVRARKHVVLHKNARASATADA
jgi:hypothetical protein